MCWRRTFSVGDRSEVVAASSSKPLNKQDITIADSKTAMRVVLWESSIGLLEMGKTYNLRNVAMRSYNGNKYLSFSSSSECIAADDFGEVRDASVKDVSCTGTDQVITGEVISVLFVDEYPCCVACESKVEAVNNNIGLCKKCNSSNRLSRCPSGSTARFVSESTASGDQYTLVAFNEVVQAFLQWSSVRDLFCEDSEKLLFTQKLRSR